MVYDLAVRLPAHGYRVVVAAGPGGDLLDRLDREGIPTVYVPELVRPLSPALDLRALRRLQRLVQDAQLVHAHSSKAGWLARLAARTRGIPAVYTAHGWGLRGTQGLTRLLAAAAERQAARHSTVVCVCEADRRFAQAHGLAGPRLAVIPNGRPDPGTVHPGPGRALPLLVGTVARAAEPKDPLAFVRLAHAALRRNLPVRFLWVGDGPLLPRARALAAHLGVGEVLSFAGNREDVPQLLSRMDVFVLLSDREGLPLSVIEAMMVGVPVAATSVGGLPELVVPGQTGWLLDPARKIEDALAVLGGAAAEPSRLAEMGRKARSRALALFSVDRMVAQYVQLYRSLGVT